MFHKAWIHRSQRIVSTIADTTVTVRLFQQVTVRKPLFINQSNKFCFRMHVPYCKCKKMITIGFTRTLYVCLLKKPIELYHSTKHFAVFLNFTRDFTNVMETANRVQICVVEKLTDNSNLYQKESTCPKLTLYLPGIENMVAYILWWLALIFMSKVLFNTCLQLRDIQYSRKYPSFGVLGEEGLQLVWWCWTW